VPTAPGEPRGEQGGEPLPESGACACCCPVPGLRLPDVPSCPPPGCSTLGCFMSGVLSRSVLPPTLVLLRRPNEPCCESGGGGDTLTPLIWPDRPVPGRASRVLPSAAGPSGRGPAEELGRTSKPTSDNRCPNVGARGSSPPDVGGLESSPPGVGDTGSSLPELGGLGSIIADEEAGRCAPPDADPEDPGLASAAGRACA